MFYNDDFRQDMPYGYGDGIDININNANTNTNQNVNMNMNEDFDSNMGMSSGPIIEQGRERCVQRNILHEVKQV